jgi:FkbM family methyltransferase
MGTLRDLNPRPTLTEYLVGQGVFGGNPLVLVDVGAKSGFEKHWDHFGSQIRKIGFEPNKESYSDCVNLESGPNETYFPIALDKVLGKRKLSITRYPSASSFLIPNVDVVTRFAHGGLFEIVGGEYVDTTSLDLFCQENDLEQVDFIKLDAEGSELDILIGAEKTIRASVLGLSVEVGFLGLRKNQPFFSDIDLYLRGLGFDLFDLDLNRYPRKSAKGDVVATGQVIIGQALYLRDAINETKERRQNSEFWNPVRVLKMATIFELFRLQDCAMELISEKASQGHIGGQDFAKLRERLESSGGKRRGRRLQDIVRSFRSGLIQRLISQVKKF